MNLRDLASHLEACAEQLPPASPRADRLQALADAARLLDRLREYRRTLWTGTWRYPMGDDEREMDNLRYEARVSLTLAADMRAIA
jgi:hypothetical protein